MKGNAKMAVLFWNRMTRHEIAEAIGDAVVVIPTGATEQHGPHLPTGFDAIAVDEIARRAAEQAGADVAVMVTPVQAFGSSAHHVPFGGTLTLSTDTYYRVMHDLVTSVLDAGGTKVFLLNGHGGNVDLNRLVARDVVLQRQEAGQIVAVAANSWWELSLETLQSVSPELKPARIPGHAGEIETSVMLAIDGSQVREPRAVRESDPVPETIFPGLRVELGESWRRFNGFTDFPDRATAETGERVLEIVTKDIAAAIVALGKAALA
jgi:creatinine amidohydrolase